MAERQLRPTTGLSGHGPFRAEFSGEAQARFEHVGGNDLHAGELEQAGEHEANRPLTGHEHDVATQQGQSADGFEDGVDGFEQGALGEGIFGGNFHDAGQDEGHDADVFGVAAARRLESGGDAGAFIGLALGEGAVPAKMAIEARDMVVQGDAVANLPAQIRGPGAQLGNHAGGFVAEDAGRRDGAVLDFFDVGGADAAGGDADEEFAGADAGDGDGFEAQVVDAAINDGAHGFGDGGHGGSFNAKAQRRQAAKGQNRNNQQPTTNIQHSTFNIQHSTFYIQHSTFNIQHSTFNIQHSTFNIQQPNVKEDPKTA
jgi:hypothetical protein